MSAGFGWSLSDVRMLARFVTKFHHTLKEKGSSASDYQQATKMLLSLQSTLEQIQHGLQSSGPSFRNAVQAQLHSPTSSIAEFNAKLSHRHGSRLTASATPGRHHGTWREVK